jgi:beta-mannosidase
VTDEIFSKQRVMLVCDGLDTVATVFLNNVSIGYSDNMFVRYEFDIKNVILVRESVYTTNNRVSSCVI